MLPKWVDEYLPPRGPCAFCGGDDARHRIVDAIRDRARAGDPPSEIASDYGVPLIFVQKIAGLRRIARARGVRL